MARRRNLLLTFDAFGTLFSPREPVAKQYVDVAAYFGVKGLTTAEVDERFRKAWKQMRIEKPNYGRATEDYSPEKWWTEVIERTFPRHYHPLHPALAPALLRQFATDRGYALHEDVHTLFRKLSVSPVLSGSPFASTIVGLISNTDPRVSSVLTSLGVARHFQMHLYSYDIGHEKPEKEIFDLAKEYATEGSPPGTEWTYIHVGDDLVEDYHGAQQAGWKAVLVDREGKLSSKAKADKLVVSSLEEVADIIKQS